MADGRPPAGLVRPIQKRTAAGGQARGARPPPCSPAHPLTMSAARLSCRGVGLLQKRSRRKGPQHKQELVDGRAQYADSDRMKIAGWPSPQLLIDSQRDPSRNLDRASTVGPDGGRSGSARLTTHLPNCVLAMSEPLAARCCRSFHQAAEHDCRTAGHAKKISGTIRPVHWRIRRPAARLVGRVVPSR